jgi:hypothetical protein
VPPGSRGGSVDGVPPELARPPETSCIGCGAPRGEFRFDCPVCLRRWEEVECRELRERLFGLPVGPHEPAD